VDLNSKLQSEIKHLESWDAGCVVSVEAIKAYGEDNVFVSVHISESIYSRIYGKSYKEGCIVPIDDLCYLKLLHYDINYDIRIGELSCSRSVSNDLVQIFKALYEAKYPIEKMILIDDYNADDEASMKDNNTSAFNFRQIVGGGKLSKHATGQAVDINPLYNPYVKTVSGQLYVAPSCALSYVDRTQEFPYKIIKNDICYQLFTKYGFQWGGDWDTIKDYQHFEK
jgi:hypothetical protein